MKRINTYLCFLLILVFSFNSVAGSYLPVSAAVKSFTSNAPETKKVNVADNLGLPQFNCTAEEQEDMEEDNDLKKLAFPASAVTVSGFAFFTKTQFQKALAFRIISLPLFIINSAFII